MFYSEPAFWISIVSLTIAGASLGWNICKEFLKPKLKLSLTLTPSHLIISATNRGPGKITLRNQAVLKALKRDIYEFIKIGSINQICQSLAAYAASGHPASMLLPSQALDIGEEDTFKIILKEADFLNRKDIIKIGVLDSTGKVHWVSRRDYKRIKREFEKMFKSKE